MGFIPPVMKLRIEYCLFLVTHNFVFFFYLFWRWFFFSDIKLVLDFVPNHSSDQSEWFQKSIQRIDPYTDYYVWQDPKGWTNDTTTGGVPIPPNNWVCWNHLNSLQLSVKLLCHFSHWILIDKGSVFVWIIGGYITLGNVTSVFYYKISGATPSPLKKVL